MQFKASRLLGSLPLLLSFGLASFVALPEVRANEVLFRTFLGTAGALAVWWLLLSASMGERQQTPEFGVALLKQHYVQASVHLSILAYWGWYDRAVYHEAYLILAQLVFAYAFDMLLQLSRRGRYTLGFGPFPVIFSTNLFLWFVDDRFYFQFLLIAVGFAAKELLHWNRGGKSVHIFNPSSFPLAIASWILLATKGFGMTFGQQIASTQFRPPGIFIFIFLVSLPGQFFFGVTTMTFAAVLTMYVWAAAYLHITGIAFHFEAYIPIAVFLAMNLLFTDPSTSPRSELGRVLFGVAYATTVVVLELLVHPAFPSKLLLVPVLNLAVPLFDRVGESKVLRTISPSRLAPWLAGRSRNLAYLSVWAPTFGALILLGGIGDDFRGQQLPFWQQACRERGTDEVCMRMIVVETQACRADSGWACNEAGLARHARHEDAKARGTFRKACDTGSAEGCANETLLAQGGELQRVPPPLSEYPTLLAIFKDVRRERFAQMPTAQVLAEACTKGWTEACSARSWGAEGTAH